MLEGYPSDAETLTLDFVIAYQVPAPGSKNTNRQPLPHSMQVLEFHPDATVLETVKTPEVLNLHPRDVYLFASDVAPAAGQQSTIVARSDAILFRSEVLRAIIYYDRAVLFPTR